MIFLPFPVYQIRWGNYRSRLLRCELLICSFITELQFSPKLRMKSTTLICNQGFKWNYIRNDCEEYKSQKIKNNIAFILISSIEYYYDLMIVNNQLCLKGILYFVGFNFNFLSICIKYASHWLKRLIFCYNFILIMSKRF